MTSLSPIVPELILVVTACALFLLGIATGPGSRKLAAQLALWALVAAALVQVFHNPAGAAPGDLAGSVRLDAFAHYVKILTCCMGVLLVLLNMPTNAEGTGGGASDFGADTAEFFGLMLLSLAGLLTVAGANDLILLFLGIELASIPTYVMVSISRPLPVAQEAGVKYFFLGAMAAAVMLFGFSYLYGTTGLTRLDQIAGAFSAMAHGEWSNPGGGGAMLSDYALLAVLMLIGGLTFKMAAVPLAQYAGDVYQGAATPVTAFLSFVPKTTGFVALIKILYAVSGGAWLMPGTVVKTLAVLAAVTMTYGNVLGLMQSNLKRVLACSSVAHSGYMLAGVAALVATADASTQSQALQGVLFYLAAYGLTGVGVFGVLMLLPARRDHPATSAETYEDLAGQAHRNPGLGLAFAVGCLSLTGLPLTVGFFAKLYLVKPALGAGLGWLVAVLVANAAISAVYYLRMIAAIYLRPEPGPGHPSHHHPGPAPAVPFAARLLYPTPVRVAVLVSALATLLFGLYLPAVNALTQRATQAAVLVTPTLPTVPTLTASAARP